MSVDALIDPPFFPTLEKSIASGRKARTSALIFGLLFAFGFLGAAIALITGTRDDSTFLSAAVNLPIGSLLLFLSFRASKNLKVLKSRLAAETQQYYNSERARLKALEGKMTPAEWENYKLQLQNQKLLVELNRRQNIKTRTTTTTTSWVAEIGD